MKKEYTKPELNTKAYAQFESVFTRCSKANGCPWVDDLVPSGSSYSEHQNSYVG